MKEKKIELGDVFYIFTNWGVSKGRVVKVERFLCGDKGYAYDIADGGEIPTDDNGEEIKDFEIEQYKLNIDIDEDNTNMKYGFWYTENQLFESVAEAIQAIQEQYPDLDLKEIG